MIQVPTQSSPTGTNRARCSIFVHARRRVRQRARPRDPRPARRDARSPPTPRYPSPVRDDPRSRPGRDLHRSTLVHRDRRTGPRRPALGAAPPRCDEHTAERVDGPPHPRPGRRGAAGPGARRLGVAAHHHGRRVPGDRGGRQDFARSGRCRRSPDPSAGRARPRRRGCGRTTRGRGDDERDPAADRAARPGGYHRCGGHRPCTALSARHRRVHCRPRRALRVHRQSQPADAAEAVEGIAVENDTSIDVDSRARSRPARTPYRQGHRARRRSRLPACCAGVAGAADRHPGRPPECRGRLRDLFGGR